MLREPRGRRPRRVSSGASAKSWSLYGWSLKPWLIPAGIAAWCVYPALTPEFKGDIKRRITDEDD